MRNWKRVMWMAATSLALAMAFGLWVATPTIAQIRAALVRDTDHPAQQPVRVVISVSASPGQAFVSQDGQPVPAGKRFVVQTVSVFGYTTDPERITGVWLTNNPVTTYVSLDPQTTEGRLLGAASPNQFAIMYNRNVTFVYNPGEVPRVEMLLGSTTLGKFANIFLHGYYVTL